MKKCCPYCSRTTRYLVLIFLIAVIIFIFNTPLKNPADITPDKEASPPEHSEGLSGGLQITDNRGPITSNLFTICTPTQQYIRGTKPLPEQPCIPKGQAIALSDSYLLTAQHIVTNLENTYLVQNTSNTFHNIKHIRHHPQQDLALIQLETADPHIDYLPLITEDRLSTGASLTSIHSGTYNTGTIKGNQENIYTTDFSLSPTDSGSPLFSTTTKKLIGINIATSTQKNTSYAVSITQLLLDQWLEDIGLADIIK